MKINEITIHDCLVLQDHLFAVILRAGEVYQIENTRDAPHKE